MTRLDAAAAKLARDLRDETRARAREAEADQRAEREARVREPLSAKVRRGVGRSRRLGGVGDPAWAVAAGYDGSGPGGARLPLAAVAGEAAQWRDGLAIDGVALPALEVPPPSVVTVPVRCAGGVVRAFAGMRPAAWFRNRGGVRFALRLRGDGGATLAEVVRELRPYETAADRAWRPLTLDLPASGDAVLELRTEVPDGADADFAWSVWGDPVLLVPAPGSDVAALPRRPVRTTTARRAAPARSHGAAPVISLLLPVHDPDPALLHATIASVFAQEDATWEMCVTDDGSTNPRVRRELVRAAEDPRVRLHRHDAAAGIAGATNAALRLATGTFVATLDHDDLLDPEAIAAVRAAITTAPDADVLYTDNDKVGPSGERFSPSLKPGWSPELLRACMYTLHLSVYRRALVEEVGGWRSAFDGAQDHDLLLRLVERTDRVVHVPQIAYAWRAHGGSAALGDLAKPVAYDRGAAAVQEHVDRLGVSANVERLPIAGRFRVRYRPDGRAATCVVVVPPERDDQLRVLAHALAVTDGTVQLVLVRPAGAPPPPSLAIEATVVGAPSGASLAAFRAGAKLAQHDVVVLVEELAAPSEPDWLAELTGPLEVPGVTASGPVVVAPGGAVRQAGIALVRGRPMPVHPGRRLDEPVPPPELTMVMNRAALAGVVAVRRGVLDGTDAGDAPPGLVLPGLVAGLTAAGGRAVCSPHVPWVAAPGAEPVLDLGALRAFAVAHRSRVDPWYHPLLWADRADHRPPSALEHRAVAG